MIFDTLHDRIQRGVKAAGYKNPTDIQKAAIPVALKGGDVIGIAQTGTGKTAAFSLPILCQLIDRYELGGKRKTSVLIIVPTRELVNQIFEEIKGYAQFTNLRLATIHGGVSDKVQISRLHSEVDIVIATPGRLMDLIKRGVGVFHKVDHFVLDEADRMLDMGFSPMIEEIASKLPKKKQTLLFSATMNAQVEKLSKKYLQTPQLIEVHKRTDPARTVKQVVYEVQEHQKIDLLIHMLESSHELYSVLVFVRTRERVDEVTTLLKKKKVEAAAIHGERKQGQRRKAIRDFAAGTVRVVVATDVLARGIDIDNITHVINFDFPEQNDDYIHRIGRTGRAGSEGSAWTFVTPENTAALEKLEQFTHRTFSRKIMEGFEYDLKLAPKRKSQKKEKESKRRSEFSMKNRAKKRPNSGRR